MPLRFTHLEVVRRFLLAFALCAPVAGAFAQDKVEEPGFFFGSVLTTEYDSNVTRINGPAGLYPGSPGARGSDIDTGKLFAGFDRVYDREHLFFSADVSRVLYRQFSLYDYTGQDERIGFDYELPADIKTQVVANRAQFLADQAYLTTVRRDVIVRTDLHGMISMPVSTYWRGVVMTDFLKSRNSNGVDVPTDLDQVEFDVGTRYQTGPSNHLDLLARNTHTTYPHAEESILGDTSYDDRAADAVVLWTFSGSSALRGHIGYLERRNVNLTFRNFSGPAYDLTYIWTPGSKTQVDFVVLRQTGDAGYSEYLSAVTHTYRIKPSYQVTPTIKLGAQAEWDRLDYFSDLLNILLHAPPQIDRVDSIASIGANLTWSLGRSFKVRLEASHQRRFEAGTLYNYFNFTDHYALLSVEARF
jgi:hypothetical protein